MCYVLFVTTHHLQTAVFIQLHEDCPHSHSTRVHVKVKFFGQIREQQEVW